MKTEGSETYRGKTYSAQELSCPFGTTIIVSEEFTRWVARFFVKRYEMGKFWQAYDSGKKHGYKGKRLEGYLGTSINNFRKDRYFHMLQELAHYDQIEKYQEFDSNFFSLGASLSWIKIKDQNVSVNEKHKTEKPKTEKNKRHWVSAEELELSMHPTALSSLNQKVGPNLDEIDNNSGLQDIAVPLSTDFTCDMDTVIDIKKRLGLFREKFSDKWELLEKWLGGEKIATREYNSLIKAFNSLEI